MTIQTFNALRNPLNTWLGWNTPYVDWNRSARTHNVWNTPVTTHWNAHQNRSTVRPQMMGDTQRWSQLPLSTGLSNTLNTPSNSVTAPAKSPMRFQAPVNVFETDARYEVAFELPGCSATSIELVYENGQLILKGKVNTLEYPESARHILTEYSVADYYRELNFSCKIATSDIKADFRNGLLMIHLPKQDCSTTKATSVTVL